MNQTREIKMAAAKARMAELAAKFVERSAGELDLMREKLAQLAGGDVDARADIHHLAHRMGGTGATLRFEALSECAMRLEHTAAAVTPGTMPDAAALTQLGVGIEAIGVELTRLRRAGK
jgi:HPt (histidine-containing phosphotransfer) domain-containing protein